MERQPLAALLAIGTLIALSILVRPDAVQLRPRAITLLLQPAPPELRRHAVVVQAAASDRWQDTFDKLKRELGAERVFALVVDLNRFQPRSTPIKTEFNPVQPRQRE